MTATPQPGTGAEPADEQRTIVEARPSPGPGSALPVGQALQEFVIEGLVGEGGFGIVYLARDTRLDRKVALKEYMPTNLAQRGTDRSVWVRSEQHRETFELGLRSFVNEAKLLASFDHPSLVKVHRFWEENGTAYMAMPFYEGPTLRQYLAELGHPPDEAWLRALLAPLIDALELIHNDHCWHRDIAPDNILLLTPLKSQAGPGPHVRPLLLDFGAARRVIGDVTHNLTVILKPGYAPIEQYAESASMKQGPWTDVYALCAVLYRAVTGRAPVPSVGRVLSDDMVSAAQAGAGRWSPAFLAAIDAGLAVRPDARPQSMAALRDSFALDRARTSDNAALPHGAAAGQATPERRPPVAGAARPAIGANDRIAASRPAKGGEQSAARQRASAAGARKWQRALAGMAVLAAAGAALGWWWLASDRSPQAVRQAPSLAQPLGPQLAPPNAAASAVVAVPAAAPVASAVPALTATTQAPASAAASMVAPSPAPGARPPPPRPAATAGPAARALPAQPALDPKRFECDVLVREGQKALAHRGYDDAMQMADEAQAVYAKCPGAAELGRSARQAKDRARSSAVIQ